MTQNQTPEKKFSDTFLKALKPKRERYEIKDEEQAGLSVRVSPSGVVTFVYRARFPGRKSFTRTTLGHYPGLTLAAARAKATKWREAIREKRDPVVEEKAAAARKREEDKRKADEEAKRQGHTFRSVAERYIKEITGTQRQGKRVARDIKNQLIRRWGDKPISEISRADVTALLVEKRKTPATAYNLLGYAKLIFAWAIEVGDFGLSHAPTDHINAKRQIGERGERDHYLNEAELTAFWRASFHLRYPERQAYRLLALTGLRLNELVGVRWSELDLDKRELCIPASRMKKTNKAREHLVPLSDVMMHIFEEELYVVNDSDFCFTITGKKPATIGSKVKSKLDALMRIELQKMGKPKLRKWVNHDLRRSLVTTLTGLKEPVPETHSDACLAHYPRGIQGRYNRHTYRKEKLEALTKWSDYLIGLGGPDPDEAKPESSNLITLRRRAA
jgi:integrase